MIMIRTIHIRKLYSSLKNTKRCPNTGNAYEYQMDIWIKFNDGDSLLPAPTRTRYAASKFSLKKTISEETSDSYHPVYGRIYADITWFSPEKPKESSLTRVLKRISKNKKINHVYV